MQMGNIKSKLKPSSNSASNEVSDAVANSYIELEKGGRPTRYYKATYNEIEIWRINKEYEEGDVVIVNAKQYVNRPDIALWVNSYEYWAMCMAKHTSNANNKPYPHEIFNDLVVSVIENIQICLIEFVDGFTDHLSSIIINYCYQRNKFWWNGCQNILNTISLGSGPRTCGNLVTDLDSDHCQICGDNILNDGHYGSVIQLDKNDGTMSRIINSSNKSDDEKKHNLSFLESMPSADKVQICNLLIRNFNASMEALIRCCIERREIFEYEKANGSTHKVNIGATHIWTFYAGTGSGAFLLAVLIWRRVDGIYKTEKWRNISMFEILFLCTSEHVRYEHYGYKMVKRIEHYSKKNGINIMTVAAVPEHGENFWTKNGFTERWKPQTKCNENSGSFEEIDIWIKQNMLVFDDTPLYAKNLSFPRFRIT